MSSWAWLKTRFFSSQLSRWVRRNWFKQFLTSFYFFKLEFKLNSSDKFLNLIKKTLYLSLRAIIYVRAQIRDNFRQIRRNIVGWGVDYCTKTEHATVSLGRWALWFAPLFKSTLFWLDKKNFIIIVTIKKKSGLIQISDCLKFIFDTNDKTLLYTNKSCVKEAS